MDKKTPIYCGLAFGSININVMGETQPCCSTLNWKKDEESYNSILESINKKSLIEFREQLINGEWPEVCTRCKISENASNTSMRTGWNNHLPNSEIPMNKILNPNDIYFLDLSLGSKCNSKCMTCSWHSSTLWEEEHEYIFGSLMKNPRSSITKEKIDELCNAFPNLNRIQFIGGEPTIMEEHMEFLQKLIEQGKSHNISLHYVTNLTGMSDKMISLWESFKYVHVGVSIDGYNKINDYIRYPVSWEKVEKNVRRYFQLVKENPQRHGISLSTTLSIFNSLGIHEVFSFWKRLTQEYKIPTSIHIQNAVNPDYVNCHILDLEYRQIEINNLKNMKETWKDEEYLPNFDQFNTLIEWLEEPQDNKSDKFNRAKTFIEKSDKFRNRSIENYLPELFNYLFKENK